ncbi:hypothetical protein PT273_05110 [Orbaceae bacterium ESL0727]|nr:hypothetical protein [Orbaceae bacterium ESL0727]
MKKLILTLLLCTLYSNSSYANTNKTSFTKNVIDNNNNRFIKYNATLDKGFSFYFYVDTKENTAVPVLVNQNKKYQAVSIKYCIDDSDECWRNPIYGDLLSEFADHINNEDTPNHITWSIEYIDDNKLKSTGFMDIPNLGALSIYADSEEGTSSHKGASIPHIIWQSDVKNN